MRGGSGLRIPVNIDEAVCRLGRVLNVHGLSSTVAVDEQRRLYRCTTRRLLKTLPAPTNGTLWRRAIASGSGPTAHDEGVIERIEPRQGVLTRR